MKRILLALVLGFLLLPAAAPQPARAKTVDETTPATLTLFHSITCPHCKAELAFLEKLQTELPQMRVREVEITQYPQNLALLRDVAERLNASAQGVPFAVIGQEYVVGYFNDETTGEEIRQKVTACLAQPEGCPDITGQVLEETGQAVVATEPTVATERPEKLVTLPLFGTVDAMRWSLPALTIVIGGLDGFNPCAMWTLVFLITLLLGMQNRKKMWLLGSAFIVASGAVYFLFLTAWLNLFLFIGFITWIRWAIGIVAIGSGIYHLREYLMNRAGECKVGDAQQKQRTMEKFRAIVNQQSFWLALIGIIGVAIAVNMIEMVCSAGLPAIYTQVLALSQLSPLIYYLYLLLYILVFMLDDIIIFVVAMLTLEVAGLTGKYSRWSNLIGGIVILLLGILLIFRPEWITFG